MKQNTIWWIAGGILLLALVWIITNRKQTPNAYTVDVVPSQQPLQQNNPSINEQPNIVGDHPGNTLPNGTIPSGTHCMIPEGCSDVPSWKWNNTYGVPLTYSTLIPTSDIMGHPVTLPAAYQSVTVPYP